MIVQLLHRIHLPRISFGFRARLALSLLLVWAIVATTGYDLAAGAQLALVSLYALLGVHAATWLHSLFNRQGVRS